MRRRSPNPSLAPWLLLGPFVVVFVLFTLYPLVQSVPLSMRHAFGPQATIPVGLEKFSGALSDPRFWTAVRNTLAFTAGSVFIQLPVALGLAMILNRRGLRGRGLFRLLFFSPQLVGLVFVAVLATVAFQKQRGLVNVVLAGIVEPIYERFGIGPSPAEVLAIPWLETLAMPTLILTALWMYAGFNMIYFLAALQNISRDLEEAAMIDGAGPVGRFVHVTLPSIKPVAMFVVLLSIIGSFQLFELPYIMLTEGVGLQDRGLTLVTYLFKNGFEAGDLGYATAIGWLLAIMLGAFGVSQRLLSRGEVGV
ncbi:MAG: carbohydrate ABC transporter permease [Phycisphaerales bacterium]